MTYRASAAELTLLLAVAKVLRLSWEPTAAGFVQHLLGFAQTAELLLRRKRRVSKNLRYTGGNLYKRRLIPACRVSYYLEPEDWGGLSFIAPPLGTLRENQFVSQPHQRGQAGDREAGLVRKAWHLQRTREVALQVSGVCSTFWRCQRIGPGRKLNGQTKKMH